jgi:hypothetical protein
MLQSGKLLTSIHSHILSKAVEMHECYAEHSIRYVCNLFIVNYVLGVADCRRAGDIRISGKTRTSY